MWASSKGRVQAVTALLDAGADPNARLADGRTAAELAEAKGHPEVARLIRERR